MARPGNGKAPSKPITIVNRVVPAGYCKLGYRVIPPRRAISRNYCPQIDRDICAVHLHAFWRRSFLLSPTSFAPSLLRPFAVSCDSFYGTLFPSQLLGNAPTKYLAPRIADPVLV